MKRSPILLRMRSRARHMLTPGTAGLLAVVLFALPTALASNHSDDHKAAPVAALAAAKQPRCFGAASRDSKVRCDNPALRYKVVPTPDDALLLPNAPCDPVYNSTPYVCEFGAPVDEADGTVVLLGDSHATHWRGALIGVAEAYNWHGVSMTRSGCTFSKAEPRLPGKLKQECIDWRLDVYEYFSEHPEVRTVFISQHPGHIVVPPGRTEHGAKLRGFRDAWKALPDTVKHIVVIRDTPYVKTATADCVTKALRHHDDASAVCALPLRQSLKEDAAADAAARYPMPGLRVADMTSYMCSTSSCYPVVGGVLTHKDLGHITAVFSTTLGPFLLRKVRAFGVKI